MCVIPCVKPWLMGWSWADPSLFGPDCVAGHLVVDGTREYDTSNSRIAPLLALSCYGPTPLRKIGGAACAPHAAQARGRTCRAVSHSGNRTIPCAFAIASIASIASIAWFPFRLTVVISCSLLFELTFRGVSEGPGPVIISRNIYQDADFVSLH